MQGICSRASLLVALNRQGRRSQKGGALDRTQFFRIFQGIATALGLSPEKVLKHSLASHLVAGNVNLALVKQSLGHRSKILGLLSQETYHPISWPPNPGWQSLGQTTLLRPRWV